MMSAQRLILRSTILASLAAGAVFGFVWRMLALKESLMSEQRPVSVIESKAVAVAMLIRSMAPLVVVVLIAASFGVVALLGRTTNGHDRR